MGGEMGLRCVGCESDEILREPSSTGDTFYYLWGVSVNARGTPVRGFLLDLIRRKTGATEARLEVWKPGTRPRVLKDYYGSDQFAYYKDRVDLGPITLTTTHAIGHVGDVTFDLRLSLDGHRFPFGNALADLTTVFIDSIPIMASNYGTLSGTLDGIYFASQPFAITTYCVKNVGPSEWNMISIFRPDAMMEIASLKLSDVGDVWGANVYLNAEGEEHKLNDAPFNWASLYVGVGDEDDPLVVFHAEMNNLKASMDVRCTQRFSQFAYLEKEGSTQIRTTVFGRCTGYAILKHLIHDDVYVDLSTTHALLESKGYILYGESDPVRVGGDGADDTSTTSDPFAPGVIIGTALGIACVVMASLAGIVYVRRRRRRSVLGGAYCVVDAQVAPILSRLLSVRRS
eukprot:TRINITY_DN16696_c0_g1_i1.p1 TRINITY_DN16696_c0_g1~~TRINITY_DN16696_c0_g1_i1.p1  ORF type:complete len:425 (+),score=82.03 TRINITY_DN16696_c0_g1_i1:76-1275(+)